MRKIHERQHIIYALVDPRTRGIRYIGKSCTGTTRAVAHGSPAHMLRWPSHKTNWIRELQGLGLKYEIQILEVLPTADALCDAERRWIAHGRAQGWPLTNLTDGGDGVPGIVFSKERNEKIRQAFKGKTRVLTPEWIEKIRAAAKRRIGGKMPPKTPEQRVRIS